MNIRIWHEHSTYTEAHLEHDLSLLHQWRREQALRYKHFNGRRDCCLSYLLLCQILQEEYGITSQPTFVIGEHGKPALLEFPHIHFNLSHCANAIVCATSKHPIGIDVESIDRKVSPSLIKHTMNTEELQQIETSPINFFRYWTQKEAVVKLRGTGLQDNLHQLLNPGNLKGISLRTEEHTDKGFVLSIAKAMD